MRSRSQRSNGGRSATVVDGRSDGFKSGSGGWLKARRGGASPLRCPTRWPAASPSRHPTRPPHVLHTQHNPHTGHSGGMHRGIEAGYSALHLLRSDLPRCPGKLRRRCEQFTNGASPSSPSTVGQKRWGQRAERFWRGGKGRTRARSPTPETLTTLKRTPGISLEGRGRGSIGESGWVWSRRGEETEERGDRGGLGGARREGGVRGYRQLTSSASPRMGERTHPFAFPFRPKPLTSTSSFSSTTVESGRVSS